MHLQPNILVVFYPIPLGSRIASPSLPFEGILVDGRKHVYSNYDARKIVCNENVDMTGKLFAGSFSFKCRIMHYILCRIFLPRSTNLA